MVSTKMVWLQIIRPITGQTHFKEIQMTEQQSLQWDADRIMEQLIMQESRHMQMGALVSYQLRYPDMTIRDFFAMASKELEEQEEELGYYE